DRRWLQEKFLIQEHHWCAGFERPIAVVSRVLKDFLKSSGRAGGGDNTIGRDGQQPVFSNAVRKVFSDPAGKLPSWLVGIRPSGYGEALPNVVRKSPTNFKRGVHVTLTILLVVNTL